MHWDKRTLRMALTLFALVLVMISSSRQFRANDLNDQLAAVETETKQVVDSNEEEIPTPAVERHAQHNNTDETFTTVETTTTTTAKPSFLIHVGPPKTGTTTTQTILTVYRDQLLLDNIDYLGFQMWPDHHWQKYEALGRSIQDIPGCLWCKQKNHICAKTCWPRFTELLREQRGHGNSILLSDEVYTRNRSFPAKYFRDLQEYVRDDWNLEFIVTYRRLEDWYPSARRQIMLRNKGKWPKHPYAPLFPGVLNSAKGMRHTSYRTSKEVISALESAGLTVRVFNFHENNNDLTKTVLCNVLPEATHACAASLNSPIDLHMADDKQEKENVFYDEILTNAIGQGLFDQKTVSKKNARKRARRYVEETLNMTVHDLPMKCPSREELEEYLQASLAYERAVVPKFAEAHEKEHIKEYWKKAETKYCSIDTDQVIQDAGWLKLFENISQ